MNIRSDNFLNNMPAPNDGPWISDQMPWSNPTYDGVMHFTAVNYMSRNKDCFGHKRKCSNMDQSHPPKQQITEEKMAATLNGLHISHDFVAHRSNTATESKNEFFSANETIEDVMDSDIESTYPLSSTKDLEEKLRRAKHITICNEFKKLTNNETIIPKALLEHFEKPSKALVIWQPPPKIKDLIAINGNSQNEKTKSEDNVQKTNIKEKNSFYIDINNATMDTDMI